MCASASHASLSLWCLDSSYCHEDASAVHHTSLIPGIMVYVIVLASDKQRILS
jgi:hypothetical protein